MTMVSSMMLMVSLLLLLEAVAAAALQQCGNTTTFCRESSTSLCCDAKYSPTTFGCEPTTIIHNNKDDNKENVCCLPGPQLEPSPDLPNCLVIGDSVSIGYTPIATRILAATSSCQLQHGPWDVMDGGAADTAYGLSCLDNFMHTQRQTSVKWDAILVNFGLHNLINTAKAKATYRSQLDQIMQHIVRFRSNNDMQTKLVYATTTPFMKDALLNNTIVEDLNAIALEVIYSYENINTVDLHRTITDHCGDLYENCDWCNQAPCDLHYNGKGYAALGAAVANAFSSALNVTSSTKMSISR